MTIAAVDIGTVAQGKNYDYQDEVIIMTNADPQVPLLPGAPVPGAHRDAGEQEAGNEQQHDHGRACQPGRSHGEAVTLPENPPKRANRRQVPSVWHVARPKGASRFSTFPIDWTRS